MCDPRILRAAAPGDIIKDDKVAGLHVRVTENRHAWYLYYRTKHGVQRRPKLGEWPTMSPESARRVAKAMLEEVAKGNDPSVQRKTERRAPTMQELWDRWRSDRGGHKKSAGNDEQLWNKNIAPYFATARVTTVTYDDIVGLHKTISERAPGAANRTLALLSTMMRYAWRPLRWIEDVPTQGVRRNPENKRRRYMTSAEATKISTILKREEANHPQAVAFLYLLIFTGARKSEIANATWDIYDGKSLRLPDSKTGAKSVQVPPQAARILDDLDREGVTLTGIADPKRLWGKIREEAGCPDLRIHDLRHSFASAAIQAGLSLAQIGELLGHRSPQTTARYAHLVEDAAQEIGRAHV